MGSIVFYCENWEILWRCGSIAYTKKKLRTSIKGKQYKELSEFLDYLTGKGGNTSFVKRLDEAVTKAKNKEEWRMEYMTLLMRDREKFEQGLEQGLEQGRIDAIQRMIRKGCTKDFILELKHN